MPESWRRKAVRGDNDEEAMRGKTGEDVFLLCPCSVPTSLLPAPYLLLTPSPDLNPIMLLHHPLLLVSQRRVFCCCCCCFSFSTDAEKKKERRGRIKVNRAASPELK